MIKTGPLPVFSPYKSRGSVAARASLPQCDSLVNCGLWRARNALHELHKRYRGTIAAAPFAPPAPTPAHAGPPKTWADFEQLRAAKLAEYLAELAELEAFARDFPLAFVKALGAPPERVGVIVRRGSYEGELAVNVELRDESGEEYVKVTARIARSRDGQRLEAQIEKEGVRVAAGFDALIKAILARAFKETSRSPGYFLFPKLASAAPACHA